jgi:tetratricopeptide (TPR) repeat protein
MRIAVLCVVSMACSVGLASAQPADEASMKAVVQAETRAWIDRDAAAWGATWLHDSAASRVVVQAGSYTAAKGWENIANPMMKDFKDNPTVLPFTPSMERFVVRQQGNLAVVEYDQVLTVAGQAAPTTPSREYRVLSREGGQWKITSQITHVVDTFEDTAAAIGSRVDGTGHTLLRAGKIEDAIAVFKVNVHLYPQAASAYSSLGEAYVAAAQKDLAIENYEKSLQLEPGDQNARAALAKLKGR